MKRNILCLLLLSLVFSCKKSDTPEAAPDYSGKYIGTINGTCLDVSKPASEAQTTYTENMEVVINKAGDHYVLSEFDTIDLEFELEYNASQGGFAFGIPSYTIGNDIKSVSGVFKDSTLTITGGRFNTDGQPVRCSFKFIGMRK